MQTQPETIEETIKRIKLECIERHAGEWLHHFGKALWNAAIASTQPPEFAPVLVANFNLDSVVPIHVWQYGKNDFRLKMCGHGWLKATFQHRDAAKAQAVSLKDFDPDDADPAQLKEMLA